MVIRISEDDQHTSNDHIYNVSLHGKEIIVTVTAKPSVARRWISCTHHIHWDVLNSLVVGLGVQWTPDGVPRGPADTLQLCVGHRCLVYQLTQASYVPRNLRRFLRNPRNTFVGFWNHLDRKKLEASKHKLEMVKDPLDLRKYVQTEDGESLVKASLEEIVEECLGYPEVIMKKEINMSDWHCEFLRTEQVLQVALDAYCAFEIGKEIRAWEIANA